MVRAVQHNIKAFMDDPDADKANPIHSTNVAKAYGFRGALVGGATAYGWVARTIIDALGVNWLDEGWAHLKFVRPIYPGDDLNATVDQAGALRVASQDEVCFLGEVGLGFAPWFEELLPNEYYAGASRPATLPQLTLDNAPVGGPLRPMAVPMTANDAETFALERERETHPAFFAPNARLHTAWIAEQLIHLLHHSYDYGPSIHAQSHIQHLRPVCAGQTFSVTGICKEAYERKANHYIVNDGAIWSESGDELVRIRHTSVFRIRKS